MNYNSAFNYLKYFNNPGHSSAKWLEDPFSISEFTAALVNKKNTSPGPDKIPYLVIKNLPLSSQLLLLNIFNQLWYSKKIPDAWKEQYVVPIPKPNKNLNNLDSYRPISLTSCFSKLFESMLKSRIEWFVEKNFLIPNN